MANCDNCSAPLPPHSMVCDYCGTRNDTDLKGVHRYTLNEPQSPRICPRCSISMQTIDLKIDGRFYLERCPDCLGLFFDLGELETLLKASVKNVYDVDRHRIDELNAVFRNQDYPQAYIKCPVCGQIMNRINFGRKSGVIIDKCAKHGIWLDGGELRHLLEWVKAGGEILSRQWAAEKKKEAQKSSVKVHNPKIGYYSDPNLDYYGGSLLSAAPEVFSIIKKVIRWLIA